MEQFFIPHTNSKETFKEEDRELANVTVEEESTQS